MFFLVLGRETLLPSLLEPASYWQESGTAITLEIPGKNMYDNVWQRLTTNDNKWQRFTTSENKWQQVKANDSERQQVVILADFPFFE